MARIDLTPQLKTKELYIFLVRTNSLFSHIISLFTKTSYTHASVGFDPECRSLYSFARIYTHMAIPAGFVKESADTGLLSLSPTAPCAVFRVRVTEQAYHDIKSELERMYSRRESYGYNYLGPIFCFFGIPVKRKNKYFCSQFVAELLSRHKAVTLNKPASLYHPRDIEAMPELKLIYKGRLSKLSGLSGVWDRSKPQSRTAPSRAEKAELANIE